MEPSPVRLAGQRLGFWALIPVIAPQGIWVKHRAPRFADAADPRAGRVGEGAPLRLLAIGDSSVAGVGSPTVADAMPGQLARALAQRLDRAVEWSASGLTGARAAEVHGQLVPELPAEEYDAIVVSVGVNDVTALRRTERWRRELGALFDALRAHSPRAHIVFAGLPPLHGFPLLPQPLRFTMGLRARTFDVVAAEETARREGFLYAPTEFEPSPDHFADDGYHPSSGTCRIWGGTLADHFAPHLAA